ncbi:hypothetical protein HZA56_02085 [Candidatus Poribacteria bacterium]|nr:hypothetical protein [Candidatus Poribacteria bacterium]
MMANLAERFFNAGLKPKGITVSEDVRRFLCEELPEAEAHSIVSGLSDLERIIRDSFTNIVSVSLEMFENPEVPEEKNIRIRIHLRKSGKRAFQQYRSYTRLFVKKFPSEFGRWFVTSVDYI